MVHGLLSYTAVETDTPWVIQPAPWEGLMKARFARSMVGQAWRGRPVGPGLGLRRGRARDDLGRFLCRSMPSWARRSSARAATA